MSGIQRPLWRARGVTILPDDQRIAKGTLGRARLALGGFILFVAAAMFLPAGFHWWNGWIFLLVLLLQSALASLYLWYTNPAIFVARSRIHKGTKGWDKVIMPFVLLPFFAIFPVAGLDYRFHWSSVPGWLLVAGYLV